MSGFTIGGLAGRIREVEQKIGGGWYVSVCWLAMCRDSGKGSKKRLEDKVFGVDKPKVTSTFRNAYRIAEKSFAEGFHAGCRKDVAEMPLDAAIDFAMARLEAHKKALNVTNMADYEDVCKYASVEVIPAAPEEPKAEEEPKAQAEGDVDADGKGDAEEGVDVVANVKVAISTMTLEQAMSVAEWLATHINAALNAKELADTKAEQQAEGWNPAEELVKAQAEGDRKRKAA
ncbi:hypothetical protein NKK48_01455 [Mesorhizobium sp. C386A]|uniref:hypothetical protein n=1 Tax=unclassified Mesorhizobium TaxID=325217 RepID=UPI0003CE64E8|nr:hypothetical protein [Mesorhizobium sp. LNJC386A00]ESY35749.1 hypothetical protein X748_14140 [Mesorhizobium sp. LNJC386A00]